MKERSVQHATFVIERRYDATPARVFAAWSQADAKARWFRGPDEAAPPKSDFDFRVGGRERSRGRVPNGPTYSFDALYQDIVPNQRIVYSYDMHLDDRRISVSVATIELVPDGSGTRLVVTEQGAYLDGLDQPAQREQGTRELLEKLGAELQRSARDA